MLVWDFDLGLLDVWLEGFFAIREWIYYAAQGWINEGSEED